MGAYDRTASFRRAAGAPPWVFGHRGVRGEAPENTMAAFELAADSGAAGVELDVRLCASGEVVVCHDPTLARSTGGRDARAVSDLPWAELSRADVGNGQRVPLLDEVLAWAGRRRMKVNVEMKRDVPDRSRVVRGTASVLKAHQTRIQDFIVSSFDPWMLVRFGWVMPGVLRGSLFGSDQRGQASGWVARVIGAEAVHPERTLVDEARCRRWKRHGKLVNVWTVNEPAEARTLADLGVDAIITDVPRKLIAALA